MSYELGKRDIVRHSVENNWSEHEYSCEICGDGIYHEEAFIRIAGDRFHLHCVECLEVAELLDVLGYESNLVNLFQDLGIEINAYD